MTIDAMTCKHPVYDVNRFHKWPHMGPCGATELHSHEDQASPPALPEGDDMIKIVSTGLGGILVIATDADLPVIDIDATLFDEGDDAYLADKIGQAVARQLKKIWGVG